NGGVELTPLRDDYLDALSSGGVEVGRDRIKRENGEFGARYTGRLDPSTGMELLVLETLTRNAPRIVFTSPTVDRTFDLDKRTGETIVRGTANHRWSEALSFEAGGEGAYNWLTSRTSLIVNSAPIHLPAANVRVEEKRGEGFAEATWRPVPTVTVEAGARFEAPKIT